MVVSVIVKGQVTEAYVKRVKTMKYMRDLSYFGILAGMVLVLCCISTSAYASSGDEPIFGIEPWFPILDLPENGGQLSLEYLGEIDLDVSRYPRGGGAPPIDIDGLLFDSYNLNTNSYGIAPSFDVTSYSVEGSVVATPEPATVLLLGMGALALRRRKRA